MLLPAHAEPRRQGENGAQRLRENTGKGVETMTDSVASVVYEDAESGFDIDFNALIKVAQREKREKTVKQLSAGKVEVLQIEQTPAGLTLKSWKTTPEQIARINAGDINAWNEFFEENKKHLYAFGFSFYFSHQKILCAHVEPLDLVHQIYCDVGAGYVKLRPWDSAIGCAFSRCCRFAPVGGVDEFYIPQLRKYPLCQN
ncbi:MAG: hypothetical protein E7357_03055 [Clostridiales bacterium]|nr:hypothetical protein [Clostridiales bacterium]